MAMATGSVFSETLQEITTTKLNELAKKRNIFEQQRKEIVASVQQNDDAFDALNVLYNSTKDVFSVVSNGQAVQDYLVNDRLECDLKNLEMFLAKATYDPSVSSTVMEKWRWPLLNHLNAQSMRYAFADLYGQLVSEWLSTKQTQKSLVVENEELDEYEHVSVDDRMESRRVWEQSVFKPVPVDDHAILAMLGRLFEPDGDDSAHMLKAMKELRSKVKNFEVNLGKLDQASVSWAIQGLVNSDLLTEEQRAALKDFKGNATILNEIADVLNMRIASIDSWSWGSSVQLEERRQVNGTFQIHMREDILQAIFLQYIGVKWSVFWKGTFSYFQRCDGVWKTSGSIIPSLDKKRRDFYLDPNRSSGPSVNSIRQSMYRRCCFLIQLMDYEEQEVAGEEGEEEANFEVNKPRTGRTKQTARKSTGGIAPRSTGVPKSPEKKTINPMTAKQKLLHILSAEILVKRRLQGGITCFRSQIDHLYSSLPHITIITVLKFFGISDKWLSFFRKFLEAPLKFADDSTAKPRTRKQGTPGSHVLSEVFSEVVLFCLDMVVNQETNGHNLWRVQDDIWFWSADHVACEKAWTQILHFTKIMGLSVNRSRTGSARMLQNLIDPDDTRVGELGKILPQGEIRWGMLYLNPESASFEIDQSMVDKHIVDLGRQLERNSGSILSWIQTWNAYAAKFFTSNFGKPAHCFGRRHVDDMLATHKRIQNQIFSSPNYINKKSGGNFASVVEFLKVTIENRFGISDIPSGFLYWPTDLGGLDLQSPFVNLLGIRDSVSANPNSQLDVFENAEKMAYVDAKQLFEERVRDNDHIDPYNPFRPDEPEIFFSFEEFIRYREDDFYDYDNELCATYAHLLETPRDMGVSSYAYGQVRTALHSLKSQPQLEAIKSDWSSIDPSWKAVAVLYGSEIIQMFGGLNIVEPGLLPMGMVTLFKTGGVNWQDSKT